ncbi:hypothetical protein B0H19DRAFT_1243309 [Mycena capillaripes]|nr:hypothetical protein B0H19DRAFT_1243309 [Mycena capillaripes]
MPASALSHPPSPIAFRNWDDPVDSRDRLYSRARDLGKLASSVHALSVRSWDFRNNFSLPQEPMDINHTRALQDAWLRFITIFTFTLGHYRCLTVLYLRSVTIDDVLLMDLQFLQLLGGSDDPVSRWDDPDETPQTLTAPIEEDNIEILAPEVLQTLVVKPLIIYASPQLESVEIIYDGPPSPGIPQFPTHLTPTNITVLNAFAGPLELFHTITSLFPELRDEDFSDFDDDDEEDDPPPQLSHSTDTHSSRSPAHSRRGSNSSFIFLHLRSNDFPLTTARGQKECELESENRRPGYTYVHNVYIRREFLAYLSFVPPVGRWLIQLNFKSPTARSHPPQDDQDHIVPDFIANGRINMPPKLEVLHITPQHTPFVPFPATRSTSRFSP